MQCRLAFFVQWEQMQVLRSITHTAQADHRWPKGPVALGSWGPEGWMVCGWAQAGGTVVWVLALGCSRAALEVLLRVQHSSLYWKTSYTVCVTETSELLGQVRPLRLPWLCKKKKRLFNKELGVYVCMSV